MMVLGFKIWDHINITTEDYVDFNDVANRMIELKDEHSDLDNEEFSDLVYWVEKEVETDSGEYREYNR
jgi:hypothetical protein